MAFPFRRSGRIVVVELFGVIGGAVRSHVYGRIFDDIRRSRAIKAVVVDIDSPGGSAIASEHLHYSLAKVAESKPVVAFIGGMGASGGYMVSCAAQRVVALPGSMIGSIGVISMRPILQELLGRMGISFAVSKSAPLKDMGAFYRQPTPEEETRMQALVDELYASFVAKVAAARHMEEEQAKAHATGEVFTGRKALELGLIDELGDLDRAVEVAAELGNVPVPRRPSYIRPRRPLRASLLGGLGGSLVETLVEETERRLMDRVFYLPPGWGL
jgi:protease-4